MTKGECLFVNSFVILSILTSMSVMLLISTDSLIGVLLPKKRISKTVMIILIFFTWTLWLVYSTVGLAPADSESEYRNDTGDDCYVGNFYYTSASLLTTILILCVHYIGILILNIMLAFTIKQKLKTDFQTISTPMHFKKIIKTNKIVTWIIGLYTVSYVPLFIVCLLLIFCSDCAGIGADLILGAAGLMFINSNCNIFVYSFRSKEFRAAICHLCFRGNQVHHVIV